MPRKQYNVGRQRSHNNYYAINGLLTGRGGKMRDLRLGNGESAQVQVDIDAIDRVLVNIFGFREDIEAVTRDFKREAVFTRGEMYRMICDLLREANEPLTTRQIAETIAERKGLVLYQHKRLKELAHRIRARLKAMPSVHMSLNAEGLQVWEMM